MRRLLPLLLVLTVCACGDTPPADALDPAEAPEAASAASSEGASTEEAGAATPADPSPATGATASGRGATPASAPGPTTEQCRTEIGPRVTLEPLRVLTEQTFATQSPKHGAGCFVAAYDPVSMSDGSAYPYVYTYTDASGDAETTLEFFADGGVEVAPEPSLRLIAVGFGDTNADGRTDVLMVHDACQTALSWLAQGDEWFHAVPLGEQPGLPACTVAEAKERFGDYWDDPVSP